MTDYENFKNCQATYVIQSGELINNKDEINQY